MSRQVTLEESDTVDSAWRKIGASDVRTIHIDYHPEQENTLQGDVFCGRYIVKIDGSYVPAILWLEDLRSDHESGDFEPPIDKRRRIIIYDEDAGSSRDDVEYQFRLAGRRFENAVAAENRRSGGG